MVEQPQIKTNGRGPTAFPKTTAPRKYAPRPGSSASNTTAASSNVPSTGKASSSSKSADADSPASVPPSFVRFKTISGMQPGLNTNAWVLIMNWSSSICNDRKKFISYDDFASPFPINTFTGIDNLHAIGIGEVRLHLRLKNREIRTSVLRNVLHVPDAAVNLITMSGAADIAGSEDGWDLQLGNSGKLTKDGQTIAWFPTRRSTEEGMWVLRQGYQFDRLWFPARPKDERPGLLLSCFVEDDPLDALRPIVGAEELKREMYKLFAQTDREAVLPAISRFASRQRVNIDETQWADTLIEVLLWVLRLGNESELTPMASETCSRSGRLEKKQTKHNVKGKRDPNSGSKGNLPKEQRPVEVIGWSLHDVLEQKLVCICIRCLTLFCLKERRS